MVNNLNTNFTFQIIAIRGFSQLSGTYTIGGDNPDYYSISSAINAINAARENVKLYGKAMDAMMEYNNNVANAWLSFFTSAQRQQYFRQ